VNTEQEQTATAATEPQQGFFSELPAVSVPMDLPENSNPAGETRFFLGGK
jgi:hypothetical protein